MQKEITTKCTSCKNVIKRQVIHKVMTCFSCKKERIKKNYKK